MKVTCTLCGGSGTIGEERLARVQFRVLSAVRAAKNGITIHDLIDRVYGDDVEGGPLSARNSMQVTIKGLNHRLKNAKIIADRKGPGARYRLISTEGGSRANGTDHRDVHLDARGRRHHGGAASRQAK